MSYLPDSALAPIRQRVQVMKSGRRALVGVEVAPRRFTKADQDAAKKRRLDRLRQNFPHFFVPLKK